MRNKNGNSLRCGSVIFRYSVGYILLLIFLIVIFALSVICSRLTSRQYEDAIDRLLNLNQLFANVEETDRNLNMYYTYFHQDSRTAFFENVENTRAALEGILAGLREQYSRDQMDLYCMVQTYLEKSGEMVEQLDNRMASGQAGTETGELGAAYSETQSIITYIDTAFQIIYSEELVKTEQICQDIQQTDRHLAAVQMCVLIAAISICFIFYRRVVYDLALSTRKLTDFAERVTLNPMGPQEHLSIHTGDEIERLAETFNQMVDTIHAQMERIECDSLVREELQAAEISNLKMSAALQATQMKLLQSRINPHFLFNTLNMITQTAYMEDAEETAGLMEVTAEMLRYSLGKMEQTATMETEIKNVKNYAYIQTRRFGSRIRFDFDIDDACVDLKVPALIVQPLVENSITHGVSSMVRDAFIKVRLFATGNQVCLEVSDNGVGMDAATLARLKEALSDDNEKGSHIGLRNIYQRLRIFFGEALTFDINSVPGDTMIRIGMIRRNIPGTERRDGETWRNIPS